jgi:hypothetical protein
VGVEVIEVQIGQSPPTSPRGADTGHLAKGAQARHTAVMASERWRARRYRHRPQWKITEARRGDGWTARDVTPLQTRLTRYRQRRNKAAIGITPFALLAVAPVLAFAATTNVTGWDWLWIVATVGVGAAFTALALTSSTRSVSWLLPPHDRIWIDDGYLLWIRWHPGTYRTGPNHVAVTDIVEVGLSDGDAAVVVRTADGGEHSLTDLGTPSERIRLATAIGAAIGPAATRVHPEQPPGLALWGRQRAGDGAALIWRRPVPGYRWAVLAVAFAGAVALARTVLVIVCLPAVAVLCYWVEAAFNPTGTGWLVRVGRLDAVRIDTRTGIQIGAPRRVVALELRRNGALHAKFGDGRRRRIAFGRSRVTDLARWLADRADVPLEPSLAMLSHEDPPCAGSGHVASGVPFSR